ncbi:hypothetical protein THI4931_17820 [Pandoraea sputorum]|nr:hypothetical protein THI4931_17820 [Pandoraea sputorum]
MHQTRKRLLSDSKGATSIEDICRQKMASPANITATVSINETSRISTIINADQVTGINNTDNKATVTSNDCGGKCNASATIFRAKAKHSGIISACKQTNAATPPLERAMSAALGTAHMAKPKNRKANVGTPTQTGKAVPLTNRTGNNIAKEQFANRKHFADVVEVDH